MAIYFEMDKTQESDAFVEYSFGRDNDTGVIQYEKGTGKVFVLKECPLDKNGRWAQRAATKLARLASSGEFPERTEWAS